MSQEVPVDAEPITQAVPPTPMPASEDAPRLESRLLRLGAPTLVLLLALGIRLWHLDQNGQGHPYYAATVRSMLASWHNFIYGSFDPAGFITVDKPPVAFWIQTGMARLIGFSGYSVLLPQAIEGALVALLVYWLVRKPFGVLAGVIAGLAAAPHAGQRGSGPHQPAGHLSCVLSCSVGVGVDQGDRDGPDADFAAGHGPGGSSLQYEADRGLRGPAGLLCRLPRRGARQVVAAFPSVGGCYRGACDRCPFLVRLR